MCIVVGGMSKQSEHYGSQAPYQSKTVVLRRLIDDAAEARRYRCGTGEDQDAARELLEEALEGPLAGIVDLGAYLTRVCTLVQLATPPVGTMMSAVGRERMSSRRARLLAVVLVEMIYFVAAGVPAGDHVTLQFAAEREDGRLVLVLAARGSFSPVARAEGSRALSRAIAMVGAMGAEFVRGVEAERMILGVLYECPASLGRSRNLRM